MPPCATHLSSLPIHLTDVTCEITGGPHDGSRPVHTGKPSAPVASVPVSGSGVWLKSVNSNCSPVWETKESDTTTGELAYSFGGEHCAI